MDSSESTSLLADESLFALTVRVTVSLAFSKTMLSCATYIDVFESRSKFGTGFWFDTVIPIQLSLSGASIDGSESTSLFADESLFALTVRVTVSFAMSKTILSFAINIDVFEGRFRLGRSRGLGSYHGDS